MPTMKQVAVLIETSRAYGRGLVRGVAQYNREHGRWSVYFQPCGLEDPPPPWLRHWKGDGILARIRDRATADAVLRPGVPVVELRGIVPDLELPLIGPDNRAVARLAIEHLVERGFRHFGFFGFAPGHHPHMDRRGTAFEQFVEEAGYHCDVFPARRLSSRGDAWQR